MVMDGDGWCDLWCALFKNEVNHRSKKIDTDGDGLTDYEEMVLMRNPSVAEKEPRKSNPVLQRSPRRTEIKNKPRKRPPMNTLASVRCLRPLWPKKK